MFSDRVRVGLTLKLKNYATGLFGAVAVSTILLGCAAAYYRRMGKEASETPALVQVLTEAEAGCEETYGIFPCSPHLPGTIFLTLVYGGILMFAAQCIGDGGEELLELEILPPSVIGGVLLPILGAIPDGAIIAMSALTASSVEEAERQINIGLGTLAGSTVMLLTIAYSGSLWLGRCDIGKDGEAIDGTLDGIEVDATTDSTLHVSSMCRHANTTGITHDVGVLRIKWFMMGSSLCYLIAQIPATIAPASTHSACLVGCVVCVLLLVVYLLDSLNSQAQQDIQLESRVAVMQELRLRRFIEGYSSKLDDNKLDAIEVQSSVQKYSRKAGALNALPGTPRGGDESQALLGKSQSIFDEAGHVNREAVGSMFDAFDMDQNGFLDDKEQAKFMRVVFLSSTADGEVPESVQQQLEEARQESRSKVEALGLHRPKSAGCFGGEVGEDMTGLIDRETFLNLITKLLEEEAAKVQELEPTAMLEELDDGWSRTEKVMSAVGSIVLGTALATLFSDAIVDSIDTLGALTSIPNFVIGFVVCPLASNASELVSSLQLAARKKKRNASVTFAQIYAACTMNNCLCLGIFFFMVWFKGLTWDYGAEVACILSVTWAVAACTLCQTTIKLWVAGFVILLYPLSLALVEGLHAVGVP